MSKNNGDKYVNWKMFTVTITIIAIALGGIFSIILATKVDVAVIKTEVIHIKENITEIKDALTANIGMAVNEDEVEAHLPKDVVQEVFYVEYDESDPHFEAPATPPLASIVEPKKPISLPISEDPDVIRVLESMGIPTTTAPL